MVISRFVDIGIQWKLEKMNVNPVLFVCVGMLTIMISISDKGGALNKVITRDISFYVRNDELARNVSAVNFNSYVKPRRDEPESYATMWRSMENNNNGNDDSKVLVEHSDKGSEVHRVKHVNNTDILQEKKTEDKKTKPYKKKSNVTNESIDVTVNVEQNQHGHDKDGEITDSIARRGTDRSPYNRRSLLLTRIVGGSSSSPASWPWQVSVQFLGEDMYWHHFCGGTLVEPSWIVSAAHCVSQLQQCTVRVVLGDYRLSDYSQNEQVINPKRIAMHGFFNMESIDGLYDIAMIELVHDAVLNSYVQPVDMSTSKLDTFNQHDICYIAGWGNIVGSVYEMYISDYLQQSRTTVITNTDCRKFYGSGIVDTQICVQDEHASTCLGDSGSPLVCVARHTWYFVGIASWIGSDTCSPTYPNVYTRVSSFEHWIRSVMGQTEY